MHILSEHMLKNIYIFTLPIKTTRWIKKIKIKKNPKYEDYVNEYAPSKLKIVSLSFEGWDEEEGDLQ